MSVLLKITVLTFLLLMRFGVFSQVSPDMRYRGRLRRAFSDENDLYNVGDMEGNSDRGSLSDILLARPSKRQWCRKGMIYNHVLGSCQMSLTALRGKSRWS